MSKPEPTHAEVLTPASFAARFRESSRVLWCLAAAIVGDRSQAEDVVQEAALTALAKLGTFRAESSFVAWMSQFVRYVALNHRRKRDRRSRALAESDAIPALGSGQLSTTTDPFDASVQRALASLGETARTCLLLKTVLELDYAEISELLEIPAGTAMSHVSRARAKMHTLLTEREPALHWKGVL